MSKRLCPIHGVWIKHNKKDRCPKCSKQTHKVYDKTKRDQTAKKLYTSTSWKKVREQAMIRDGGLCQQCRRDGFVTLAVIADHIVEVSDGGCKLCIDNVEMLCRACHNRKTSQSASDRSSK